MPALLAFSSDIDYCDWQAYQTVHQLLASELGLHVGDSFWLFDPNGGELSLFKNNMTEKNRYHDEILEKIQQGHFNTLHSTGNFSAMFSEVRPSRHLLSEGLAYLKANNALPKIWTNHGDEGDLTNLGGASPRYQMGDYPASRYYVMDLLIQFGFQYFWLDHHCSNDFSFGLQPDAPNPILVTETTRSGHTIQCFRRYRGALPKAPTATSFEEQLTDENIGKLIESQGVSIVYQHWGAHRKENGQCHAAKSPVFSDACLKQLKKLRKYQDQKLLNIMTLPDLLDLVKAEQQAKTAQKNPAKRILKETV
jgi:hypothetical protein